MLTSQEKAAWIKELRDPSNRQWFEGMLSFDGKMCALGVLKHKVLNAVYKNEGWIKFEDIYWNMPGKAWSNTILCMNDANKQSFTEIADWIEQNVETKDE